MRPPRAALAWHLCWGIVVHMAGAHKDHCVHVHPRPDEVIHGVHIEPAHVMRRRSADQQLRVKLSYDRSVFRLSKEKFDLINNTVLPQAVQYWEKALRVRRVENVIRLNRKCLDNKVFYKKGDPLPYCKSECENVTMCGEVAVPTDHLQACRVCNWLGRDCHVAEEATGPGLTGADFVFYISALETDRCHRGMTVAYAAHCQQEAALDRPIAGHANLCPSSISTKQQELQTLISTVKHEMLHALGFSVSLYAFFRDKEGNPLTERGETGKPLLNPALQARQWSDKIIKTFQRPGWLTAEGNVTRTVQMVVTPRVVEEVRRHFDCPELEGAELEDQGEEGTALTHWEKRLFENEAMTGTHTQNPVYSRLTLALMEDTGWYLPNYEMAQPLRWGRGLGCQFAMNSCKHWMDMRAARNESPHPFCNKVKRDPLETECTEDRNSVALCNLVQYQDRLPARYQNFDSVPQVPSSRTGYYGGSVILADYCPYIQEFTWKSNNVIVRGSHCSFSENNPDEDRNFALEEYAASSRCFEHTRLWEERTCHKVRQWQHWGSGCYRHTCLAGRVHVTVANHTYTCFHEGQEIDISLLSNSWLHVGAIRCPRCSQICPDMECKPDRPVPETVRYYADSLRCGAGALAAPAAAPALLAAAWSLALSANETSGGAASSEGSGWPPEPAPESLQSLEPLLARRWATDGPQTTGGHGTFRPPGPADHQFQPLQPTDQPPQQTEQHFQSPEPTDQVPQQQFQSLEPTEQSLGQADHHYQLLQPADDRFQPLKQADLQFRPLKQGDQYQSLEPTDYPLQTLDQAEHPYQFQTTGDADFQFNPLDLTDQYLAATSSGMFQPLPTAPETFQPPATGGDSLTEPAMTAPPAPQPPTTADRGTVLPPSVAGGGAERASLPAVEGTGQPPATAQWQPGPPPAGERETLQSAADTLQPLATGETVLQPLPTSYGTFMPVSFTWDTFESPSSSEDRFLPLPTTQETFRPLLSKETLQSRSTAQDKFRPLTDNHQYFYQPVRSSGPGTTQTQPHSDENVFLPQATPTHVSFQSASAPSLGSFEPTSSVSQGSFQSASVVGQGGFQPVTAAGAGSAQRPSSAAPALFRPPPTVSGGSFRPLYQQPEPAAGPASLSHRARGRRPAPWPAEEPASSSARLWSPPERRHTLRPPPLEWGSFRPLPPAGRPSVDDV